MSEPAKHIATCETNGHLFGASERCIFCGIEKVTTAAPEPAFADWQPIETAPHNEAVLLFMPRLGHSKPEIEVGCASHGSRNGPYSCISYHGRATHWMPLPEPPK